MHMYNALIVSDLLYGAETWALTETTSKALDTFDNLNLRKIERVCWHDYVTNEEIRNRTEQPPHQG